MDDNLRNNLKKIQDCSNQEELSSCINNLHKYCRKLLSNRINDMGLSSKQIGPAVNLINYWAPNLSISLNKEILLNSEVDDSNNIKVKIDIEKAIKQISDSISKYENDIKSIALNGDRLRTSPDMLLVDLHKIIVYLKRNQQYSIIEEFEELLVDNFGVKVVEYDAKYSTYFASYQSNSTNEPITTVPALVDITTNECVVPGKYVIPLNN